MLVAYWRVPDMTANLNFDLMFPRVRKELQIAVAIEFVVWLLRLSLQSYIFKFALLSRNKIFSVTTVFLN